ncbi:MAG: heterodisulfide reductase-related iron-sulfur binding cluster [Pseudomonadota bacterium]
MKERREGSLEAPTRHPLDWKNPQFYDADALESELERVFDICHGCRRCFNLCNAFPTLFDLVDESDGGEVEDVDKREFKAVVDNCYLCDMCYMSKCPYVPPHEWNVDFPHLMLRAKAAAFRRGKTSLRDRVLSSTDAVGRIAGVPVVAQAVNAVAANRTGRAMLDKTLGVHRDARLPPYDSNNLRKRVGRKRVGPKGVGKTPSAPVDPQPTDDTTGRVALFATCFGNRHEPQLGEHLLAVFRHNGIDISLTPSEVCCGMPKLELGDLDAVARQAEQNIPMLVRLVDAGHDIVAPVPSCVLMFKQELPLMFPDDADIRKVQQAFFDPFEYLMLRHRAGLLKTDFKQPLGKVAYQVSCHLRVQNIGLKTRDVLSLVPETEVMPIERCAGHNGTYAVKTEFHESAKKIARPVVRKVDSAKADYFGSDCALAGHHVAGAVAQPDTAVHPLELLSIAYGLTQ